MAEKIGVLRIRVEGRGCGSCVAPVKAHLLRIPGVRGVHVVGYNVYVFLDPAASPENILGHPALRLYYRVRDHEYMVMDREEALSLVRPRYIFTL